mmetsp:Transcript_12991/g.31333  ORF Transcript_12991/g.31333 Transcript_12991/m.31333 type:complete len:201 (+) Transcript_12991:699-1301(+)
MPGPGAPDFGRAGAALRIFRDQLFPSRCLGRAHGVPSYALQLRQAPQPPGDGGHPDEPGDRLLAADPPGPGRHDRTGDGEGDGAVGLLQRARRGAGTGASPEDGEQVAGDVEGGQFAAPVATQRCQPDVRERSRLAGVLRFRGAHHPHCRFSQPAHGGGENPGVAGRPRRRGAHRGEGAHDRPVDHGRAAGFPFRCAGCG